MKYRVKYTIAVPVHNGAEYIAAAIESVLAQEFGDWELIIVENGSTDDTYEVIKRYEDRRIRVFEQPQFVSIVENWNTCLDKASGEWFCLLGADDVLLSECLSRVDEAARAHPACAMVFSPVHLIDSVGRTFGTWCGALAGVYNMHDLLSMHSKRNTVNMSACFFRRDFIGQVRFSENFPVLLDWRFVGELYWSACVAAVAVCLPQPLALYRVHQKSGTAELANTRRWLSDECRVKDWLMWLSCKASARSRFLVLAARVHMRCMLVRKTMARILGIRRGSYKDVLSVIRELRWDYNSR